MGIIKNIEQADEMFQKGSLYVPMFGRDIEVWIENEAEMDYAERCAEHLTALSDEMIDTICEKSVIYYQFMLEEWGDFEEVSGGILNEIRNTIPEDAEGRDILKYITSPSLYILSPESDDIGYSIECGCVWEPEHGLEIIIRNNTVLYVGPAEGLGAWEDDDVYEIDY